jgi:hypothetical protein
MKTFDVPFKIKTFDVPFNKIVKQAGRMGQGISMQTLTKSAQRFSSHEVIQSMQLIQKCTDNSILGIKSVFKLFL